MCIFLYYLYILFIDKTELSNAGHGISVNDDVIKWNNFPINEDKPQEGNKKRNVDVIVAVAATYSSYIFVYARVKRKYEI